MALGEHRLGVSSNFVSDIAAEAEGAIAADDDQIDLAASEQQACGVIGDDLVGNPLLREFPCS